MADKSTTWKENSKGRYYVDTNCISCDTCVTAAPKNFKMNDSEGHAFVSLQPTTPEEVAQCEEAAAGCPVEAIGADGEEEPHPAEL